jgi:signal recognition particle GTPase
MTKKPKGLYAAIHAKRKRIAAGSGEKMRKVGSKSAPTAKAFKQSAKTAKKK